MTIRGGHIAHTGLHGVDFEVNDDASARSVKGVVAGVDIRHTGDLPAAREHCTCYAVAAEGYSTATKPSIRVEGLTGDVLRMTIRHTAQVVVRDNVSGARATARFPGSDSVIFSGNTRIDPTVGRRSPPDGILPQVHPCGGPLRPGPASGVETTWG